jgi:hypothetical protein
MTTTPDEPLEDPHVTPSGNPDAPEPVSPDPDASPVQDPDPDASPNAQPPGEL